MKISSYKLRLLPALLLAAVLTALLFTAAAKSRKGARADWDRIARQRKGDYVFASAYQAIHAGQILPAAMEYAAKTVEARLSAAMRSEGAVISSMMCMVVGFGTNLVLDPLFIFGFKMGVAGAA